MIQARHIVVAMTSHRPEIREQLSPETGFYFILTDIEETRGRVKTIPEWDLWGFIFSGGPIRIINIGMCVHAEGRLVCTAPAAKNVRIQTRPFGETCENHWCTMELHLKDWSILTHEMAHAVDYAARQIDPNFQTELEAAYENAKANNLWDYTRILSGHHAMLNPKEYWAVASEYWFYTFRATRLSTQETREGVDIPEQRREDLKERDPLIYALLEKWYPKVEPFGTQ